MNIKQSRKSRAQLNPPDDYELKIDEQVNKFLDLNHKLTFFMITAAVGTLVFTLNFAVKNEFPIPSDILHLGLVVSASAVALLSAAFSLVALPAGF